MINLVFHDISHSPDQFDLEPAHFQVLVNAIRANFNEQEFRIYFDDGKVSSYQHASSLRRETNFTVVCAVVSGLLDQPGHLSQHQVQALARQGVSIASHGHSHAALAVSKSISYRITPRGGLYINSPVGFDQRLTEKQVLFQLE